MKKRKKCFIINLIAILLSQILLPTFSYSKSLYGGVDSLGRSLSYDKNIPPPRTDKTVGLFYYLAVGNHGLEGPYDNNKIFTNHPDSVLSEINWVKYGGGPRFGEHHASEPLFGYYTMNDDWVLNKHVQMLTNAGIDYLIFDTTNAVTYDMTAKRLLKVLNKYYQAGYTNVPKIAYYTNSSSGTTINHIYTNIYMRYPEYSHLWFMWDGKPLIIGHPDDPKLSKEAKDYFRVKVCYWPTEKRSSDDQWPWIEFGGIYTDEAIYGLDGRKEVINVSSAQHCSNVFSASAFYGAENRTKSYNWFKQKNEDDPDAYLYGSNFKDQWEWAIEQDPETIFVTQWNEWIAMRLEPLGGNPIIFVDSADPNNCRDIEPMRGGYGDNYYMQLCEYVRKFKGQEPVPVTDDKITIDIKGSFDQWAEVYTTYTDYIDEIPNRKIRSFGGVLQEDTSGRNDFSVMKLANDKDFYYFYVETTKDITSPDKNWMTLFINSLRGKNLGRVLTLLSIG